MERIMELAERIKKARMVWLSGDYWKVAQEACGLLGHRPDDDVLELMGLMILENKELKSNIQRWVDHAESGKGTPRIPSAELLYKSKHLLQRYSDGEG